MDDRPHRIRLRTDRPEQLAGKLLERRSVIGLDVIDEATVIVETDNVHELRRSVAGIASAEGARLWEVVPLDDDLDSVFRYLVGHE
jgi:ABC-2 type transport system ATP-binding protein